MYIGKSEGSHLRILQRYRLVLLFFFLCQSVYAQEKAPVFRHFTPEEGLPSSQIYQALQDKDGFLWFASDHGIAKYNGYEFKVFTSANGLSDNTVFKLLLDARKRVWLQTFSGKLFYVENDKIKSYKYNTTITAAVQNNIPQGFYVDSLENVWFSAGFLGEFKISSNGKIEKIISYSTESKYNRVYFDEMNPGKFLTSGNSNFMKGLPVQFYFRYKHRDPLVLNKSVTENGQATYYQTKSGIALVAFSKNLYSLINDSLKIVQEFPSNVTGIAEDCEHHLYVSTFKGLFKFDINLNPTTKLCYLPNEYITGTVEDNEGGIWISTLNNGVFYLNSTPINNYHFRTDEYKEPLCLTTDLRNVFAGFWNGRIVEFNANSFKSIYDSQDKEFVNRLYYDSLSTKMYVAKNNPGYFLHGTFYPFKGSGAKSLKGNFVRRRNDDLINATTNGIYKIETDSFYPLHGLVQRTNCIFETSKKILLLGCNNGVYELDNETGATTLLATSLNNIRVDDINESNGILCFASRGEGLILYKDSVLQFIHESDGLCNNIIHRLAVSGDIIWCASYSGLSKVSLGRNVPLSYSVKNVGIQEGLPSNEINDILLLRDTLWVASKTAISYFDQRSDFSNNTPPLLHFTSFIINSRDTLLGNHSKLPYSSNNIGIGFEALSYKSKGKITYNYSLINESDTFSSNTKDRHVEFLSLKPGKYIFSVVAINNSGRKSEGAIKLQFEILAPYWQTWWFKITVTAILLIITILIIRQRILRIKEQESLKTDFNKQIVQLEIKALRAQMNPHFIFNVINSIQDYILKNDSKSARRYLTKFAKLVRLILDNSVEGEVLLSEELKANTLYVELEQQRFDEKFEFVYELDEEVDEDAVIIPSMIIQPFLENSIKHGLRNLQHQGRLLLKVTQSDSHLIIIIEDNGIGREKAFEWNKDNVSEHISRGSLITSERVSAYNKIHNTLIELTISDLFDDKQNPAGTRVELRIPVRYRSMG
jgi:hypothetical protein